MSNRQLAKAIQQLFRQIWKLYRGLSKGFVTWLLRLALLPDRRRRRAASGFVLPTTVFLILVVTLTSGALTYRAFSNSARVIGNVQSKEVYNAATPAIDRARVKLESLFADPRYPGGVPSEAFLTSMMLNDGRTIKGTAAGTEPSDPFTIEGEVRVDVNEDGLYDNAWLYHDAQTKSTIVYSITFSTPPDDPAPGGQEGWQRLLTLNEKQKADGAGEPAAGPFVRSGPLGSQAAANCRVGAGASPVEVGWYRDESSTSKLRKRFQVNAFVVKDDAVKPGKSGNFTTLEFAQDRLLDRGNKWGAWFRNDLEVYPGGQFNWNGAMHSEGSIFVGGNGTFNAYLISSPNSCLFLPESNSEISVRQKEPAEGSPDRFLGVIGSALARDNIFGGSGPVHIYNGNSPGFGNQLTTTTHWVVGNSKTPIEIALNPDVIVKRDGYQARGGDATNADSRLPEAQIAANPFAEPRRFSIDREGTRPYLDDTYRADNLYGPKSIYKDGVVVEPAKGERIGEPILPSDENFAELTRSTPTGTDPQTVGADGYWERRAMFEGMRLLVGERLELGNPSGWVAPKNRPATPPTNLDATTAYPAGTDVTPGTTDLPDYATIDASSAPSLNLNPNANNNDNEGDPLYPPYRVNDATRPHEERERKAIRDNLAAVQATAVYHYGFSGGTYPVACLATTAHPGTVDTLKRSVNFTANQYLDPAAPWVDFFSGNGTNGWEFAPPAANEATFASQVGAGQALGNALRNLASFAGDPEGAYPPQQGTRVRPDPTLTMWGNFSNLRRAITNLNTGSYNSLSPADKTYLQTASCTLGMLAHNINQVQNFDLAAVPQADMFNLGDALFELIDGTAANGEVITPSPIANYTARTYDNVTPAMMLAALKTNANSRFNQADRDRFYKLGVLIHEKFQIQRDRTYGFRPSPAANTWNYNPYFLDTFAPQGDTLPRTLWSSACDPTVFAPLVSSPPGATPQATLLSPTEVGAPSLGLSRLCGTVTPPGIFHDAQGDTNFPARGGTVDANLPKPTNLPDYQRGASANTRFAAVPATDSLQATVQPEFPALYYIFPELQHGHLGAVDGNTDHRQPGNGALDTTLPVAFQPWKEPYVNSSIIGDPSTGVNRSVNYAVVGSGSVSNPLGNITTSANWPPISSTDPEFTSFDYRAINPLPAPDVPVSLGVTPRAQGSWTTPTATPGTNSPNRIVTPTGTNLAISFQDKVLFNGREWQPSRVLDLDLDLLRNATASGTPTPDTWLPKSGIVYAFREDAVREDAISRPPGTTASLGVIQTSVRPGAETDPPMTNGENSTKVVDYVADPDRRVHGFRLRNGERLRRAAAVPANDNVRGLSFFSDDVVYIMGDFNRHQNAGGTLLEEFREQLNGVYNEASFYGRSNRDSDFARNTDEWRPSEVLGDSVTILSRQFCDGSANDAFIAPRPSPVIADITQVDASVYNAPGDGLYGPGCVANGRTSFLNQNRPSRDPATGSEWAREIPNDPTSPVKVSRNGNPLVKAANNPLVMPVEYAGRYNGGAVTIPGDFYYGSGPAANNSNAPGDRSVQTQPPETTVNTIMISGIIPSRNQQAYGGLHNFPRFLENWAGQNLRFSGSFIQLNFSNYSTAPYDQDVWEAGATPNANEVLDYYQPPVRLWGYDVGLQIAPAGPAASRFVQLSSLRNEFYTEPPANDFYMQNLCRTLQQDAQSAPNGVDLSTLRCPA